MRTKTLLSLGLLSAALAATGCGDKASPAPASAAVKPGETAHAPHGQGPNGGVIIDLGKDHAEFTVDHPSKTCTILFLDGDKKESKPMPVASKEFTVSIKATKTKEGKDVPAMTVKMLPQDEKDGKASKFTGTDPSLGMVADFQGTITGLIDGKPASGEFKE